MISIPHLTVAYITARRDCRFAWFTDSLHRECGGDYSRLKIVVVDFFANEPGRKESFQAVSRAPLEHVPPKPTVWMGPHRLTKKDYFAPANTRNTALCLAPDGWIAYVDDLSVLMPGWLQTARSGMVGERVTCGAYRKVMKMVVESGNLVSFEDYPDGHDSRWDKGSDERPVKCTGGWLFGCSLMAPVSLFLKINGWPEYCDSTGIGGEDCMMGVAMANNGCDLWYDRRLLTYESQEGHKADVLAREDKNRGNPAKEKSHALVRMLRNAHRFENYFEPGGIAALREKVLKGGPFPIAQNPRHDWHDGQPLSEL